jgi:hypothetical protein
MVAKLGKISKPVYSCRLLNMLNEFSIGTTFVKVSEDLNSISNASECHGWCKHLSGVGDNFIIDWLIDWLTDCVVCIPWYYSLISAYYNPSPFLPLILYVKRFWTMHPWPIGMYCLISHLEVLRRSRKICQDGHAWTNIQTGTYQKQSWTTNCPTATFCALTC